MCSLLQKRSRNQAHRVPLSLQRLVMDDAGIFLGIIGKALKAGGNRKEHASFHALTLLQMTCLVRATMVSLRSLHVQQRLCA